jgi:Secretion system C-terminal sorting domain
MKKYLFFLFLLFNSCLFAQNDNFCGTKGGRSEWLKNYQLNKKSVNTRGDTLLYVPLTVHILGDDNGKGYFTFNQLLDAFCTLNKDFEQVNIQFFLASEVNYIDKTEWYNHADFQAGSDMMNINNVENTINCYIVANPAGNCGYDYPGLGIALNKGCTKKNDHTWAHEMGHELSLPHNFSGWEGTPYDYEKGAPKMLNGQETELYDGSNCATSGDGFCDTEADFFSSRWSCGPNQKSNLEVKDASGKKFKIRGDFFMSYAIDDCMSKFSAEQIEAMRANCLTEKRDFLASKNPYQPMVGEAKQTFPADSAVNVNANKVTLKWAKVKNAKEYYLELGRLSSFTEPGSSIFVQDTFYKVTLLEGKKYFWRVRPFNYGFSCVNGTPQKRVFYTANAVGTNEILQLEDFLTYPNPVGENQEINVQFNADFDEKANVILSDYSGKTLKSQPLQIINGENKMTLNVDFPRGIYFLQIKTQRGSKVEKVVF